MPRSQRTQPASPPPVSPEPPPLTWKRGTFRVLVAEDRGAKLHELQVRGPVSGPFGVFRGDGHGPTPEGRSYFSLIHLPTGLIVVTLQYRHQCMAMAAELVLLRVDWDETDPQKVVGEAPDKMKVQAIHSRYRRMWQ
ncbi:MAG TPA: hypothetical protein VF173_03330 [Thermoanaerobaculia bacterium]|nr:hypothetical protein [Thermoanaerobaculia bacterium]